MAEENISQEILQDIKLDSEKDNAFLSKNNDIKASGGESAHKREIEGDASISKTDTKANTNATIAGSKGKSREEVDLESLEGRLAEVRIDGEDRVNKSGGSAATLKTEEAQTDVEVFGARNIISTFRPS
jgi:hypothetical protein